MPLLAILVTTLVAVIHGRILILGMFLWTKPCGRRIFGTTEECAVAVRVLAANPDCTLTSCRP